MERCGVTGHIDIITCGVTGRVDIITAHSVKRLAVESGLHHRTERDRYAAPTLTSVPVFEFPPTINRGCRYRSYGPVKLNNSSSAIVWSKTLLYFRAGMSKLGFDIVPGTRPITPVMLYDAPLAQKMANRLLELGIYVIGFFYPVVPKGKARIRVTGFGSTHTRTSRRSDCCVRNCWT
jgi:glycine C-acetyltransferase